MPTYMSQFSYGVETWKQLAENPEDRRDAIEPLLESLGGRLIAVYYAFGDYDGVVIFEAPDGVTAAAAVIAAIAPGHVSSVKTTRLLTVDEMQDALAKTKIVAERTGYDRPGGSG
ncbi:MAG: GYD domain-containing protein [Chloroflexota bacterium]|nr:GYD domain-containing protein [Chloroflexota bacterium]MDE2840191.1 GYD domain-containing protein [Chloroflexota bacterium]MDE2931660.1 GYD domain-containing protein [Chloroflexota bacterium]